MAKKKIAKKAGTRPATKKSPAKAVKKKSPARKRPAVPAARTRARTPATAPPSAAPDRIAEIAYQLYLDRLARGVPGDERSDWLTAERALQIA